jgi:hypothetical protein
LRKSIADLYGPDSTRSRFCSKRIEKRNLIVIPILKINLYE